MLVLCYARPVSHCSHRRSSAVAARVDPLNSVYLVDVGACVCVGGVRAPCVTCFVCGQWRQWPGRAVGRPGASASRVGHFYFARRFRRTVRAHARSNTRFYDSAAGVAHPANSVRGAPYLCLITSQYRFGSRRLFEDASMP